MDITIVGAGQVGRNVGRGLSRAGHKVAFAVREPSKIAELLEDTKARVVPIEEPPHTDLVLLATPFSALAELTSTPAHYAGKIVIDATNPLSFDANGPRVRDDIRQGPGSGAEWLAERLPDAKIVKAFNTHGAELNTTARVQDVPADGYLAGDDADARAQVEALMEGLGFAPVDLGGLTNARVMEAIAVLWIHQAMVAKRGRNIAIKVIS